MTTVFDHELVTAPAVRAARGLLHWGVRDLAREAHVSAMTITRLERGERTTPAVRQAILHALDRYGVEITNGEYTGARKRLDRTGDET